MSCSPEHDRNIFRERTRFTIGPVGKESGKLICKNKHDGSEAILDMVLGPNSVMAL